MKKWFIQRKWFRDLFPSSYFVKVNGVWNMYSKDEASKLTFGKDQKIDWVTGPDIFNWIYCQNHKCDSIVNFGESFIGERKLPDRYIWDYKCTCCETKQHFIPVGPFVVECTEEGVLLPSESAA